MCFAVGARPRTARDFGINANATGSSQGHTLSLAFTIDDTGLALYNIRQAMHNVCTQERALTNVYKGIEHFICAIRQR